MEQREPPAPRVHPALPDQWVQLEYREQQDLLGHKDLLVLLERLVPMAQQAQQDQPAPLKGLLVSQAQQDPMV